MHMIKKKLALRPGALALLLVIPLTGCGSSNPSSAPAPSSSSPASNTVTDPAGNTCDSLDQAGYCPGNDPTPSASPTPSAAATHSALTDNGWALIAKDPDSHSGEGYVVYGEITQFDSATGNDMFRADVGGTYQAPDSIGFVNYPTNTFLTGDPGMLANYVQGDTFRADITVTGSYTYTDTMGGSTTVPELQVDSITKTGHVSS